MDINNTLQINAGDIANKVVTNMPPAFQDNILFILNIIKAIGIAFLIYLIFIIIRAIVQIGSARRIKKISKNVEEINNKLDLLVHKNIKRAKK